MIDRAEEIRIQTAAVVDGLQCRLIIRGGDIGIGNRLTEAEKLGVLPLHIVIFLVLCAADVGAGGKADHGNAVV